MAIADVLPQLPIRDLPNLRPSCTYEALSGEPLFDGRVLTDDVRDELQCHFTGEVDLEATDGLHDVIMKTAAQITIRGAL